MITISELNNQDNQDNQEIINDPLWELGAFKEMLCSLFMANKEITDLVMPELDDKDFTFEENWIGGKCTKTITGQQKNANLQGHCLTTPFIEGVVSSAKTFIAMETYCDKVSAQNIKNISIQIYIYAHRDFVRVTNEERKKYHALGYAGNRCDILAMAINRCLMNKNIKSRFGIGDLSLCNEIRPVGTHMPSSNFYGRVLSYTVPDFYVTSKMRGEFVNASRL
jgi:hypothetical protein